MKLEYPDPLVDIKIDIGEIAYPPEEQVQEA